MPDLTQSISKQDLGFIQIVARFWGIEPGSSEDKLAYETPILFAAAKLFR